GAVADRATALCRGRVADAAMKWGNSTVRQARLGMAQRAGALRTMQALSAPDQLSPTARYSAPLFHQALAVFARPARGSADQQRRSPATRPADPRVRRRWARRPGQSALPRVRP